MLVSRPFLYLSLLVFAYCSAKPLTESKENSKEVGTTTDLPSGEKHTTEEGHAEKSTSEEHKDEPHEENHSKDSTEAHVTKLSNVTHSKHEQKTTPAPQTNHVEDVRSEASE